jgi:hypothetical protein
LISLLAKTFPLLLVASNIHEETDSFSEVCDGCNNKWQHKLLRKVTGPEMLINMSEER